jgi:hypothetical protein
MRKTIVQLSAALAFAAAAASPALAYPDAEAPRVPTAQQEQDYKQLRSEYAASLASSKEPAKPFESGTLPAELSPHLHTCTTDHKLAQWPVSIEYAQSDLDRLGTSGSNGQTAPANIPGFVNRIESQIDASLQSFFLHSGNTQDSVAMTSPAAITARTAALAKLQNQIAGTYRLTVTFGNNPLTIEDDPVCGGAHASLAPEP